MAAKHNAAQAATRGFLSQVGPKYDAINLGLAPKDLTQKALQKLLLRDFDNACVYCGTALSDKTIHMDHVVPMNKTSMGLHMLGNLAASCLTCNQAKGSKSLDVFLSTKPRAEQERISELLISRRKRLGADVDVPGLKELANNLSKKVASFVENEIARALAGAPAPGPVSKTAVQALQKKSEFDFSQIAASYPIGSLVKAKADGQTGVIVDYSLEGPKGKRTAYVVFLSDQTNKKVTRSPNQVTLRKHP